VRLEIVDLALREQVSKPSLNNLWASERNQKEYRIELKSKLKQQKKFLLKRFFTFYLSTLLGSEEAVEEYLTSLRLAYSQLRNADKFTLIEVEESINEMEVD
jgi:hypothetical protein